MRVIILFLFLFIQFKALAQPQWKFHLAFEDATGARDTVWLIWDEQATLGTDLQFGEGPVNFDSSKFCVWVSGHWPASQTMAIPLDQNFGFNIYGYKCLLPLKVTWDSSLLTPSELPEEIDIYEAIILNDYIFFNVSGWGIPMTDTDQVVIPDQFMGAFPLGIGISKTLTTAVKTSNKQVLSVWNDGEGHIKIKSPSAIKKAWVYSLSGSLIREIPGSSSKEMNINISHLLSGIYFLKIINHSNEIYYEKIIKM